MTDDQLNELLEAMRAQTETMNSVTNRLGDIGIIMAKTVTGNAKGVKDYDDALGRLRQNTEGLTRLEELALKQKEAEIEREANRKAAAQQSVQALKSFASAVMNAEVGFGKYGKVLDSTGDAAVSLGKNFGVLGTMAGYAVKGLTTLGGAALAQADNLLKATDSLSKIGGAGGLTTRELVEMGHRAGLTSKTLDLMVKPLQSLGNNLNVLGSNADNSIKAFGEMTAVSKEQRMAFQRLGVSQQELMQSQADYVALQAASGRNLKAETKDRAALQRASLEYTENLLTLAKITGEDVESIKKKQMDAARAVEFQIAQIQLENKARKAEQEGRTEDAARFRKQAKDQQTVLEGIAAFGNETVTKGARQFLSTGAVAGEEAAALARMGLMEDLVELRRAIQAGEDAQKAQAKFQDAYNKKFGETVQNIGTAAQFSKNTATAYGISETALENYNKRRDQNSEEELKAAKAKIEAAKGSGRDPAADARAALTQKEIEARVAIDKLTLAANPLVSGFNKTTTAATVLAGAATAAALALGAVAVAGKMTSGVPSPGGGGPGGGGGGGGPGGGGGGGGARSMASKALRFAGKAAAPLAVIGGGMQAYSGYKDADEAVASGKMTSAEATVKKSEAVGEGAGSAIGGIIGGALGSFLLPGVGTIAGAAVGSYIGGYFGKEAGTAVGTSKAKSDASAATEKGILDLIGRVESGGNYNILVGGKTKDNPPLTEMTVGQVLDFQSGMRQMGHESTAVGKYQIIRGTLAGLFQEGVVGYNDKFDQSTQDKLAEALLKRRGFEKYKAGQISSDTFADNLAKEWASLPMASGKSYYAGTGSNKSLIGRDEVLKAIGVSGAEATQVATASPTAPGPKEAPIAAPPVVATATPSTSAPTVASPEQSMPMAARGGIFSGSISGYPVELHGDELVAPIDPNSILAKMLTAGPGQAETLAQSSPLAKNNSSDSEASKELVAINMSMLEMMSTKLDTVIDRLGTSNDIQDKLLKYSSV